MNKQIIVTGSLAFDTIMDFKGRFSEHILADKIHSLNLSFLVDEMQKTQGGTSGNIAYNLGLLGCHPVLLSTFGKDGAEYRNFLKESGVDVSAAPVSKEHFSAQSFIVTDKTDNQIASFYPGAMLQNSELKINNLKFIHDSELKIKNCFVVISPNTPASMSNFVNECIRHEVFYMYDPGMQLPRIDDEDLKNGINNCEILIGNDYEVELMKKRVGEIKPSVLVVTLGGKGAVTFDHRKSKMMQSIIFPSKPKSSVDPTGAGDAFRAGFLAGYIRNFDLKTCGQMGATCAVYTVERYGTTTHKFSIKEFCIRFEQNYGVKLLL